jgi:hypothetical protein
MRTLGIAALAALALGTSAQAAVVLDQSAWFTLTGADIVTSGVSSRPTGPITRQSQSLTAGLTGKLKRIDLRPVRLGGAADLIVSVARGIVGRPGYTVLGTNQVAHTDVPLSSDIIAGSFLSVDVSSLDAQLHPGQILSIGLTAATPASGTNAFAWAYGEMDGDGNIINFATYADGYNQRSNDGGATWLPTFYDRSFRTWVDTSFVPEPASWAMIISGFGLMGAAMRRQRKVAYDL